MASIQKRGTSYRIKVSCGYDTGGKQVVQTMTWRPDEGMTQRQIEKEVNRQAVLFEQECMKGNVTAAVKFEDFTDRWFSEFAERSLKGHTLHNYRRVAPSVFAEIGHIRIDKITKRHIQAYAIKLADTQKKRGSGTYSSSTVYKYLNMISSVFDYAIKLQFVSDNPCRNIFVPKKETAERKVYTLEEMGIFLETLEDDAARNPVKYYGYYIFFTLAVYTGFRKGELLGLEYRDIDFKTGMVTVSRTSYYTPERGIFTDTPKTEKSVRSLKLPQDVLVKLLRYQAWQREYAESLGNKWIECGRLFTSWNGSPLSPNSPGNFLSKYLDYNGLPQTNVHGFRHLNASLLISGGVDVKTVQACLGHSTAITTLNIYAHSFQEQQVKAMDVVADAIKLNTPKDTIKRKKIT